MIQTYLVPKATDKKNQCVRVYIVLTIPLT